MLDLRVLRREGIDADHFSGLAASLGPEYGQSAPMHSIEARFGIEKGRPVGPTQVQAAVGWVYQTGGAIAQFRVDGNDASAILIQALEASLDPATVPLLLDIDAFREVSLPPEDPSVAGIFEQLRRLKNDIFFASITERTVEMYE